MSAPGENITSLSTDGNSLTFSGTSASAPFVTGVIALLYSLFPKSTVTEIKSSVLGINSTRRNSIVPPLLNAWAAYQSLAQSRLPQASYARVTT